MSGALLICFIVALSLSLSRAPSFLSRVRALSPLSRARVRVPACHPQVAVSDNAKEGMSAMLKQYKKKYAKAQENGEV